MTAQAIITKISKYLEMRYGKDGRAKKNYITFRWNQEHTSFYIYNTDRDGRPKCLATLRISDHGPELNNYVDPKYTGFHYASDLPWMNFSIEFYDPRRRYDNTFNRRAPYNFIVNRFCYAATKLTAEDVNQIIVNMIAFIEDPKYTRFSDPLVKDKDKKAFVKHGKAFKANIPIKLPEEGYEGPLNHFNTYESQSPDYTTYIFETFDSRIDLNEAVEDFITREKENRRLYESIMKTVAPVVRKAIDAIDD